MQGLASSPGLHFAGPAHHCSSNAASAAAVASAGPAVTAACTRIALFQRLVDSATKFGSAELPSQFQQPKAATACKTQQPQLLGTSRHQFNTLTCTESTFTNAGSDLQTPTPTLLAANTCTTNWAYIWCHDREWPYIGCYIWCQWPAAPCCHGY